MDNWNVTELDVNEFLTLCSCGSYLDLRDPFDVIKHLHPESRDHHNKLIENDPAAHPKNCSRMI